MITPYTTGADQHRPHDSRHSHFKKGYLTLCMAQYIIHTYSATLWPQMDSYLLRQRLHWWMRWFQTFGSSSHSLAWHHKHARIRKQSFRCLRRRFAFENLTATSWGWEKRSSWQTSAYFQDRCPKCRERAKTQTSVTIEIHCCCKTERLDKEVLE